jgi:acyl-CoA thioester hydrolase
VRYAKTDQMGVAWHGNVCAWFEVGRADLLRERGMTYRELEADDVRLPVIVARARYRRPVFHHDLIEVRTGVVSHSGARTAFEYEIHREGDSAVLAIGLTVHAAVAGRGRPCRPPDRVRRPLA